MLRIEDLSFTVPQGDNDEGKTLEMRDAETRNLEIIDHLDLTIDDDKLVVITGPNGGGKSTLAKLIMGVLKPTGGKIYFDDQDITDMPIHERARLGIGYGFQTPARFKGMTVRKLLSIASGQKLAACECNEYLSRVGLCSSDYLNREVDKSLSGGELKRIEIATILARDPKLAIYDEPEAGIDLWSFERLTGTFRELHEKRDGRSTVIISHQERIIDLADELVILRDGKVVKQGPKEEVAPELGFEVSRTTNPNCVLIPRDEVSARIEAAVAAGEAEKAAQSATESIER